MKKKKTVFIQINMRKEVSKMAGHAKIILDCNTKADAIQKIIEIWYKQQK